MNELEELNELLRTRQIDEKTYNSEVKRLEKIKLKNERKEKEKKEKSIFVDRDPKYQKYVVIIILVISIGIFFVLNSNVNMEYELVDSLSYIESPKQSSASGNDIKHILNIDVNIEYKAEYEITGRVIDVQKYNEADIYGRLVPVDIGLAWGIMAGDNAQGKVKWISNGDRVLRGQAVDTTWVTNMGGMDKVFKNISNNHLIGSTDEINNKIKSIKTGQYVKISGYLVSASYDFNGKSYYVSSSLTREDQGLTACEVIYVTDIVWLKEK